jgi:PRTRC genetic system protein E
MFFTAIHQMMTENVDLTIVIRKANGQLTVATLPKSNGLKDEAQNQIIPLTVTGTPQELDAEFLQAVTRPIQKASGLIANMAQFEAQADKAAANSKAAKEAKSKESKEEREKREKYEKLMKKAEDMTVAKNYREALNLLGQAKPHANEAQLKEIEEKTRAVEKEMNRGSLFDLMERQAQPEQQPVVQNRTQPQPQQVMQPQPTYAPARQAPASKQPQRQPPMQQPERPEFGQPPVQQTQQTGLWPLQQPELQPVRQPLQPHPHHASQNTGAGQDAYGTHPATGGWRDESFLQEDEQQQPYFSDSEQLVYNPKDYEDYIDFPQSMLEPKYSPYQTR